MPASSYSRCSRHRVAALVATALAGLALFAPSTAAAAEEPEAPAEAAPPPAPSPRRFGGAGQVIIGDLIGYRVGGPAIGGGPIGIVGFGHSCQRASQGAGVAAETCSDAFWLAPSADVGIGHGLTLGGTLRFDYRHTSHEQTGAGALSMPSQAPGDTLSLTMSPRLGYVINVNEDFAVWPRVGAGFYGMTGSNVQGWSGWNATAGVGLVFRAGRYVYLNAAPELTYGQTKSTWQPASGAAVTLESSSLQLSASASIGLVLGS